MDEEKLNKIREAATEINSCMGWGFTPAEIVGLRSLWYLAGPELTAFVEELLTDANYHEEVASLHM